MSTDAEKALKDRVYRDHKLRARVAGDLRKRPDVAENSIMALLAETYLDGVRDGDGFGLDTTLREAFRDEP